MREFKSIDENVNTYEFLYDKAIVNVIRVWSALVDSKENDGEPVIPFLINWQAVNTLQKFFESYENVKKSLFNCIHTLNGLLRYVKRNVNYQT